MSYKTYTDQEVTEIFASIPVEVLKGRKGMRVAYTNQKCHAKVGKRAPMELTVEQFCVIWWASGHWHERGVGTGCYSMCRKDDTGSYSMGNVRIDTQKANLSEQKVSTAQRKAGAAAGAAWGAVNGKKTRSKPIIATCKKTLVETEYPSAREAARKLKCTFSNIGKALAKQQATAAGHYWRFVDTGVNLKNSCGHNHNE